MNSLEIIGKAININKLAETGLGIFDQSRLNILEKIMLLDTYPGIFDKLLDLKELSTDDKVAILLSRKTKYVKRIELTEGELVRLSKRKYIDLISLDFKKYIRKDMFSKLPLYLQRDLFISHPMWVIKNIGVPPHLSNEYLTNIAKNNPAFIDSYITDLTKYRTGYIFWYKMIKYNSKYKEIFIRNTRSVITKSDVRAIIFEFQDIIELIDADIISNSKLTVKEWILLINNVTEDSSVKYTFDNDIIEMFKLDLMSEVLNGKSTMSTITKRAMNNVFNIEEKNENQTLE